jgi:hypothetical protein
VNNLYITDFRIVECNLTFKCRATTVAEPLPNCNFTRYPVFQDLQGTFYVPAGKYTLYQLRDGFNLLTSFVPLDQLAYTLTPISVSKFQIFYLTAAERN